MSLGLGGQEATGGFMPPPPDGEGVLPELGVMHTFVSCRNNNNSHRPYLLSRDGYMVPSGWVRSLGFAEYRYNGQMADNKSTAVLTRFII